MPTQLIINPPKVPILPEDHISPTNTSQPLPNQSHVTPQPPPNRPGTPERPEIEPLTPKSAVALLNYPPAAPIPLPPPVFIPRPSPVPISEDDNSDVVALRAAISILQLQRDKAKRDIKTIDELKNEAMEDPDAWLQTAIARRNQSRCQPSHPLSATIDDTLRDVATTMRSRIDSQAPSEAQATAGAESSTREVLEDTTANGNAPALDADAGAEAVEDSDSESDSESPQIAPRYGPIPAPQKIARMPAINWAKYRVVGESLDKLHEEQLRRPTPGEPTTDKNPNGIPVDPRLRAPEYAAFSEYNPLTEGKYQPAAKTERKHGSPEVEAPRVPTRVLPHRKNRGKRKERS
ncbi:hypothetical protein K402DRAFT_390689 [Aulographum hederae CBS 113979]|uniref:Uncharacterized protein n=1 Tax=Aulographum hederae CBS 113979 TaxID=1176131 RepID=A0A6G1H9I7_9PEZI|nr:hypothetical protein K402DRAFT_390689 [Aulographum hederae CBS 113979]